MRDAALNLHVMNEPGPATRQERPPIRPPFRWRQFIGLLLGPGGLTALTALLDSSSNSPAPAVALLGSLVGGLGIGVILGRRWGRNAAGQILVGLLLAVVGAVVCLTIATFGCLASGYQLNMH